MAEGKGLRIGVVAGEASGDQLGAGLVRAIHARFPDAHIEGVAGPRMVEAGCHALFPSETLAVMGLVEVIRHLPALFRVRRALVRHFRANPPDVFVGIDSPDFNLPLERKLKAMGIPTVHYVSPSVWAWRQGRVRTVERSVDLMLALFPFEAAFYEAHGVPVRWVGHPLADEIPMASERQSARQALGLPVEGETVALLPGSRRGEVGRLRGLFVETAARCLAGRPGLRFVAPMATPAVRALFSEALEQQGGTLPVALIDGRAREAIAAADVVLVASGTATLEAMLLKRPMVMAYKVAPLTAWIVRALGLMKISRFALPNLLSREALVPEYLQDEATPDNLAGAVLDYLANPGKADALRERFAEIHAQLRRDASRQAADAVLQLVSDRRVQGKDTP